MLEVAGECCMVLQEHAIRGCVGVAGESSKRLEENAVRCCKRVL
jgi:hypothetical protein